MDRTVTVSVTISHAQRDAVYDQILDRLSGIEDIWLAASNPPMTI